jgi:BMFP domain-containing protein YqiC
MQSENRLFDDLSKVATGAIGAIAGMGREMEAMMRQRFEEFVGGLDLVRRDEFDAVKEMATTARAEAQALAAKVAELEAKLAAAATPAAVEAPPAPKPRKRTPKAGA